MYMALLPGDSFLYTRVLMNIADGCTLPVHVDIADLYQKKLLKKNNGWFYEYDHAQKPVIEKK